MAQEKPDAPGVPTEEEQATVTVHAAGDGEFLDVGSPGDDASTKKTKVQTNGDSDKPGIEDDPIYQTAKMAIRALLQKANPLTEEKRELKRLVGQEFLQAKEMLSGTGYGKQLAEKLSEDLHISSSVLYDARLFATIDPGDESEFPLRGENVPWDWVRDIVRKVKTPEQLWNFLDGNPGLASGSRDEFSMVLETWYKKYHNIEEAKEDEGEGNDDDDDGDDDDGNGGDKGKGSGASKGGGKSNPSTKTTSSKDKVRDQDTWPDEIDDVLLKLRLRNPSLAEKVQPSGVDDVFSLELVDLDSVDECWEICHCFAEVLRPEGGE